MTPTPYQPTDRRPIASRRWTIWQRAATGLARRGISPNAISITGMICGLAAGAALATTACATGWERLAWLLGAVLIQLRLLANLLDGMVAIESGRASPVGELYNEVPDRVSDTAILIGTGYALGGDVVLGFAAACAAMFTAYVRATGKGAGASQAFAGPMAKPQRMALLTVLALYAGLAPTRWQPIWQPDWQPGWTTAPPAWGLAAAALLVITLGSMLTAIRRLRHIATELKASR